MTDMPQGRVPHAPLPADYGRRFYLQRKRRHARRRIAAHLRRSRAAAFTLGFALVFLGSLAWDRWLS
ncbi:hypothetical protein FHS78_000659 [Parvibaculum indicum]|uniref:hypothetical protein n=1 Tax=Parvibaculum indicum TaxID=562969 RepID=UPI001421BA9C|nr:hypothetical protein [Parvibaculum indicum]NIJ40389.1 hypothetical protein [Parvibaculum indicum]